MASLNLVTAPNADMVMARFPVSLDEDYQEVGSLGNFQHKLAMANDPAYRAEVEQVAREEVRRPRTLRAVLGIPEGLSMRLAFPFAVRV